MAELADYLSRHTPVAHSTASWSGGAIRLEVTSYLSREPPPLDFVTSVRAVVLKGNEVLTMRNEDEWHVLPGGRREPGETPEGTLRREVLEEAGWRIERPVQLGFVHLHHLTPKPAEYEYPYPDFLWLVYVAEATTFDPNARLIDDYETEAVFRSAADTRDLSLADHSLPFLRAASLPFLRAALARRN